MFSDVSQSKENAKIRLLMFYRVIIYRRRGWIERDVPWGLCGLYERFIYSFLKCKMVLEVERIFEGNIWPCVIRKCTLSYERLWRGWKSVTPLDNIRRLVCRACIYIYVSGFSRLRRSIKQYRVRAFFITMFTDSSRSVRVYEKA